MSVQISSCPNSAFQKLFPTLHLYPVTTWAIYYIACNKHGLTLYVYVMVSIIKNRFLRA